MMHNSIRCIFTTLLVLVCSNARSHYNDQPNSNPLCEKERNKQLREVYELLSIIDNAEQNLGAYADTKNEQLRAKFLEWRKEIRDRQENLAIYENTFKADPLLFEHAKSVLVEDKRLKKIDFTKGFKYYSDDKVVAERSRKLNEFIDSLKRAQ